jgi:hypothetical protein
MRVPEPAPLPKAHLTLFLLVAALSVSILQNLYYQMPKPELDALRYIDYALNIHEHQVFGLSGKHRESAPEPGNANSPLYPAMLALALAFDSKLEETLRCVITHKSTVSVACPAHYDSVIWAQLSLMVIALGALWTTVFWLFSRTSIAWLSCVFTLASTKPMFFANSFLTETLILFLFPILLLSLIGALRSRSSRWWMVIGATLGLMTLTRPEYLYLAYCLGVAAGIGALFNKRLRNAGNTFALVLAFCMVVGPWLARNQHQFGSYAVTGGYGDIIIAYRSSYNQMTLPEWAAAFVYWLPGHGEALATRLLPPSSYEKLGTDANSYIYTQGTEIFNNGLAAVAGDRDRLMGYLIKTEILAHPVKHTATSLPLAWRGILAGKYLAVVGLPCFIVLIIAAVRGRNTAILIATVPAIIMISLYAAVSMSIPRYNVYLIYYYGFATAWFLISILDKKVPRQLLN